MSPLNMLASAALSTLIASQMSLAATPMMVCINTEKPEQKVLEVSRASDTGEVVATVPSAPAARTFRITYMGYPGHPQSNISFYLGVEKSARQNSMLELTLGYTPNADGSLSGLLRVGDNFRHAPEPISIGKYSETRVSCKATN